MTKVLPILAISVVITSCASKNTHLDLSTVTASKPTSITISKRDKPDFTAYTAGKAVLGAVGGVAEMEAPSLDELLGNNAERLKKELQEEAEYCVAEFKKKVFSDQQ